MQPLHYQYKLKSTVGTIYKPFLAPTGQDKRTTILYGLHTIIMKKSFKSALLSLDVSAEFNEIQLILYQNYLSNWNVHGTNDEASLLVCIRTNLIL